MDDKKKGAPRLDEVFGFRPLNVGQAYSLSEAGGKLGPKFEPIVKRYAEEIILALEGASDLNSEVGNIEEILRNFAQEVEKAEGEDPGELG